MDTPTFSPGFYFSVTDVVVLVAGILGSLLLGSIVWWYGAIIGFVILHFFLFCNVFRISRSSELIWAAGFIVLAGSTIVTEMPGWIATGIGGIALSSLLVWRETRRSDYHGICWQVWNPDLPEWWESNHVPINSELSTEAKQD